MVQFDKEDPYFLANHLGQAINDETERRFLMKIDKDALQVAPPSKITVEDIMRALRIAKNPPPPPTTLVFHPRHYETIHSWWSDYEHRDQITLIQNQQCAEDKLYTFPTSQLPGVV